jgi:hypothetical protein
MPSVGFEPTITVFEWVKTVHALDHAATVIGYLPYDTYKISCLKMLFYFYFMHNTTNDEKNLSTTSYEST